MSSLREVFVAFASFGSPTECNEMDGKAFIKVLKDTGIVDKIFSTTDADLLFASIKPKGGRKIGLEEFQDSLPVIAKKKKCPVEEVMAQIVSSGGPKSSGTKAEAVKFHDDKSLYTGVHANGGPSNVDRDKGLASLLDRSPADVRGIKHSDKAAKAPAAHKDVLPSQPAAGSGGAGGGAPPTAAMAGLAVGGGEGAKGGLQGVFEKYCAFGGGKDVHAMDGAKFAKLCKECGLVDKKFTTTSVDIIFAKAKSKSEKKILFNEFKEALRLVAAEKGLSPADVEATVVSAGAPKSSGTVADAVKFHDDKSLYTGVYAKGGPTNVDDHYAGLEGLLDRSPADVRGIKR